MVPSSFEESNLVLHPPPGLENHVECLSVASTRLVSEEGEPVGPGCIVSCWKLTDAELTEFMKTGRVWLVVLGTAMPPVQLSAIKPGLLESPKAGDDEGVLE